MPYELRYTASAALQFDRIQRSDPAKHRKVVNCLRKLGDNPKHPGLHSHKYASKHGPQGEEVWESYVGNNTPAAWRVFWCYGPDRDPATPVITVIAITPHP